MQATTRIRTLLSTLLLLGAAALAPRAQAGDADADKLAAAAAKAGYFTAADAKGEAPIAAIKKASEGHKDAAAWAASAKREGAEIVVEATAKSFEDIASFCERVDASKQALRVDDVHLEVAGDAIKATLKITPLAYDATATGEKAAGELKRIERQASLERKMGAELRKAGAPTAKSPKLHVYFEEDEVEYEVKHE